MAETEPTATAALPRNRGIVVVHGVGEQADLPPWSRFELPHVHWSVAEVWWSTSNRQPDLKTMLVWSWRHLGEVVGQLRRSAAERVDRLLHPAGHPTQPPRWAEAIDLLNCLGLLVLYPLAALVGYVLLVPLMVAAQSPLSRFRTGSCGVSSRPCW